MPSRRRPTEALDADLPDGSSEDVAEVTDARVEAPFSEGDADEEVARAEAVAAAARLRAVRLRQLAEGTLGDQPQATESPDAEGADSDDADDEAAEPQPERRARWRLSRPRVRLPRPGWKACVVAAEIVIICASLAASGWMVWQDRIIAQQRQRSAEFAAAARHGIITMLSIDANHAKEDLQRVVDDSTGEFKDQLELTGQAMAKGVEQTKISTKATVDAVAVQSMTDNSAVVLVAAKSDMIYPDNKKSPMTSWRIILTLSRDGGQLKMSKVEFVQ